VSDPGGVWVFAERDGDALRPVGLEILGRARGDYAFLSPNDHVNRGQSTNDTYPAAAQVAVLLALKDLKPAVTALTTSLRRKQTEFASIAKAGRTHLKDAMPVTLGAEFGAYASALEHVLEVLEPRCRREKQRSPEDQPEPQRMFHPRKKSFSREEHPSGVKEHPSAVRESVHAYNQREEEHRSPDCGEDSGERDFCAERPHQVDGGSKSDIPHWRSEQCSGRKRTDGNQFRHQGRLYLRRIIFRVAMTASLARIRTK
jgi:hypothetical protein